MLSPTSPIGECESNWKGRLAAMERPLNEYWASLNGQGARYHQQAQLESAKAIGKVA